MAGPNRKKLKLEDDDDDVTDFAMNDEIRTALTDIDDIQSRVEMIDKNASKEFSELDTKYSELRKSIYERRSASMDKVPNFWNNALINHPEIAKITHEDEEHCIRFLKKLEVEEINPGKDNETVRIKLTFDDENPFFENKELVKELQTIATLPEVAGTPKWPKSTSTKIKWMEHLDLSKAQNAIIKDRKKKGEPEMTFFSWFSDNSIGLDKDHIAECIIDELWTEPLKYFFYRSEDKMYYKWAFERPEDDEESESEEDDNEDCKKRVTDKA